MDRESKPILKFVRLCSDAFVPTKGSPWSAGYDLYASEDVVIHSHGKACVSTGLMVSVPPGTYGRIAPRSGLALKYFIDVGAGVVDSDYRGPLKVVLFNHGEVAFIVKIGDRIAQLICEKIEYPELREVVSLEDTLRGNGGFGSTGQK
jgi:dUTP pyrophosphatase